MNNFFFLTVPGRTLISGTVKTYNEIGWDDFGTTIQEYLNSHISCATVAEYVCTYTNDWYIDTRCEARDE